MKTVVLIPAAAMAVALLSGLARADMQDPPGTAGDTAQTSERSGYVGTSLSDPRRRVNIYTVNPAFPNRDLDESGFVVGNSGPERGQGDEYGSVLLDIGAR
jgi:hypothetical protein